MKTKTYFRPLSLSLSLLLIGSTATLNAQSVRVPGGNVGNSNNDNVGINVTNPQAKLDIATDENTGAFQIYTTENGFGLNSNPPGVDITPFAYKVIHNDYNDVTGNWSVYTTALLSATGNLSLGNFASINATHQLNLTQKGLGVYKSTGEQITLSYMAVPGFNGPALNYNGTSQNFSFTYNGVKAMQISPNQQVLIGTELAPADYKLCIGGKAIAEEVVVRLQNTWPDYVFAPDYTMLTNAQLRQYITENGKLPYLPAAAEVAENGVALGETQTHLTRLVEELTLRLLEMEERIQELESQLAEE